MEDSSPFNEAASPLDGTLPEGWVELPPALPPLGILAGMSDLSLANIASYGHYQQVPAGTVIIKEGGQEDRFFVVVAGKRSITALPAARKASLPTTPAADGPSDR